MYVFIFMRVGKAYHAIHTCIHTHIHTHIHTYRLGNRLDYADFMQDGKAYNLVVSTPGAKEVLTVCICVCMYVCMQVWYVCVYV
jgi:hypothetical protein